MTILRRLAVATLLFLEAKQSASLCRESSPSLQGAGSFRFDCTNEAHVRHHVEPYEINVDSQNYVPDESSKTGGKLESTCEINENGSFGHTTATKLLLDYFFEIRFNQNVLPSVESNVLSDIESSISSVLLAVFFNEKCVSSSKVVGGSTVPVDSVLPGVHCRGKENDEQVSCVLVNGLTSLFVEDDKETMYDGSTALHAISLNMDRGSLNYVHDGIISYTFINGSFALLPSVTQVSDLADDGGTDGQADGSRSLPVFAYIMIGSAVVVVLVLGIVFRWRRNRLHRQDEASMWLVPLESPMSDTFVD